MAFTSSTVQEQRLLAAARDSDHDAYRDLVEPHRAAPESGSPADPDLGPGEPLLEAAWIEPYPDQLLGLQDGVAAPDARCEERESVELAFIAALQRARQAVDERLPVRSQQATLRTLGDERLRALVRSYVDAWESRDVDAMVAMLVEDATFSMPPQPRWYDGRDAVIAFIAATGKPRLRHIATRANGGPAVAWYLWDEPRGSYLPASLEVLAFEGARVREITAYAIPELFAPFGLPAELGR